MVAISFFALYYCSVYYFETHFSLYFLDSLFVQLFSEFKLPSWLMLILGGVVLVKLIKMVSSRLSRIGNYNFVYIGLVFLLTSCEELREGCATYPLPDDWKDECDNDTYSTYVANYSVHFATYERNSSSPLPLSVDSVNFVCKVTRWQRLPHPFIPDTCYWSSNVIATLVGTTDEKGKAVLGFPIEFTSTGDFFIIEGSFEKQGYNRELYSNDYRYYFYRDEWVPCSAPIPILPPNRMVRAEKFMTQFSASP